MLEIFDHMSQYERIKLNITLEESCGLIMEITNIILSDFAKFLDKFVSIQPPNIERMRSKAVVDEIKCFSSNNKLFGEVTIFLKGCYEVYLVLIKQVDDMTLNFNLFNKAIQFLNRARFNVSKMISNLKSIKENFYFDKKLYTRYVLTKSSVSTDLENNQKKFISIKYKSNQINYYKEDREFIDLAEKIRRQFQYKINEQAQRARQLNHLLYK